ncbi:hypothetical protein PE066_04490 [Ramlibacter tataouinensis]|uniref:hypothetical protein n=1 Tax=Ramlibacter tataouinensis TaxID=94132 RepID=UPI0022F3A0DD|nr:hypothetical protein [Ramlibacter tataouinensis]WBY02802.1 hypothetical protein PE066_04490 [Ramlibacter tataouinensis]
MKFWAEELAMVEAAALRIESLEHAAERRFDEVHAAAVAQGSAEQALETSEFAAWMAARADTDAAWGRWSQVMDAKPAS